MNEQVFVDYGRVHATLRAATPVFACDMSALDPAQRRRHIEVTRQFLAQAGAPRELPNGYAFAVGAGAEPLALAAEFVSRERLCCPFLEFRLVVDATPTASLRITGPEGVKPFLRAELDLD